jgi:hypothetical protein
MRGGDQEDLNDIAPFGDFLALKLGELFGCAANQIQPKCLGPVGHVRLLQDVGDVLLQA